MHLSFDAGVILQSVVIPLILWAIRGIAQVNGSVNTLNEWRVNHEKQDDERYQETKERDEEMRTALTEIKVHQ